MKIYSCVGAKAVGKTQLSAFDCCRICIQLPRLPGAPPAPGDVPSADPEPFPGARAAGSRSHVQAKPLPARRWAARAPRLSARSRDMDPARDSSIRRCSCWTDRHGAESQLICGDVLSSYGTHLSLLHTHLSQVEGVHRQLRSSASRTFQRAEQLALSIRSRAHGSAARMAFTVLSMNLSLSMHLQKGEGRNVFGGLTQCSTQANSTAQFADHEKCTFCKF